VIHEGAQELRPGSPFPHLFGEILVLGLRAALSGAARAENDGKDRNGRQETARQTTQQALARHSDHSFVAIAIPKASKEVKEVLAGCGKPGFFYFDGLCYHGAATGFPEVETRKALSTGVHKYGDVIVIMNTST
jgi:hypothetical protein